MMDRAKSRHILSKCKFCTKYKNLLLPPEKVNGGGGGRERERERVQQNDYLPEAKDACVGRGAVNPGKISVFGNVSFEFLDLIRQKDMLNSSRFTSCKRMSVVGCWCVRE